MTVHGAASGEELNDAVSIMGIFPDEGEEQFLNGAMKNEKIKNKLPKLKDFFDKHCRCRQYSFQVCNHKSIFHDGHKISDTQIKNIWMHIVSVA